MPAPFIEFRLPNSQVLTVRPAGQIARRVVARDVRCDPGLYYFAALPVPDRRRICGAPATSSLMINSPVCCEVSGGAKVTETLQLFPGANVVMHCLLTAKGAAAVSPVIVMAIPDFFELPFLIITSLGLLTEPTLVYFPN